MLEASPNIGGPFYMHITNCQIDGGAYIGSHVVLVASE